MTTTTAQLNYCEGCERCNFIHPLTPEGYCVTCAFIACEEGEGERVGLPHVPDDLVDAAIARAREMLVQGGDTLIMGLSTTHCAECDRDWLPVADDDHVVVTCEEGDFVLIGCEGYHQAALRAAALTL